MSRNTNEVIAGLSTPKSCIHKSLAIYHRRCQPHENSSRFASDTHCSHRQEEMATFLAPDSSCHCKQIARHGPILTNLVAGRIRPQPVALILTCQWRSWTLVSSTVSAIEVAQVGEGLGVRLRFMQNTGACARRPRARQEGQNWR